MLEVENLTFKYPGKALALEDISISLEKGTKTFFHGANGAGKTTLLQCLNGLLKPKSGKIKLDGAEIKNQKQLMQKVGIVFQNPNDQIISGSVYDEVAFGPLNMGLSIKEVQKRVEHAMDIMNISSLKDSPPHFLSYGQKKSVAIASVLSMDQDIIMLDEPTAGLDAKQTKEFITILNKLSDNGKTLLICTHDAEFSFQCADWVIILDKGKLIAQGETVKIFSNDDILKETGLKKPIVLEFCEALIENGIINPQSQIPRNISSLKNVLKVIKT